ncbi:MAG: DUF1697 domain-containing protein [Burkholderiales bacterium]|nr:DUF1697 domain-containing protein [Burkholderiales bacterium]
MPRFAVLLRGVNVGKGNRVPMAEFKVLLEQMGYTDVKTLLNSGNAVFSSSARSDAKLSAAVAAEVERKFGVSTPVIVKSAAEVALVINEAPMTPPDGEQSRFLVAFGQDEQALQALSPLLRLAGDTEHLVITRHAAYLHSSGGLLESKIGEALLGKAGRGVTTRNWATVLKVGALLGAA